ncbi:hypothetical protein [Streptomyces sp. NPDC056227]|uniref:hypothetical protein n=1 Tax=Streptomyces sp. NPDC056227 TaxID=3345753 RepID=UPI0035DD61BE
MNKRPSRPLRFAAVDNDAIDNLPSMLAVGMLTAMIRAKDGDEITVASLCEKYSEGREAVTKTMRILVEEANVVKFKIQRAVNEEVINEAGEKETKRGGSWYTTFSVDSIPFTAEDVAAMVDEIYDGGNVKALRVEPERLDPRKPPKTTPRPRYGIPSVGPTCGNEGSDTTPDGLSSVIARPRPTDGFPTVGRPTAGQPSALYRKKTVPEDSLSAEPGGQQQDAAALNGSKERETASQKDDNTKRTPVDAVVEAYVMTHIATVGMPPRPHTVKKIRGDAEALLAAGRKVQHLEGLAADLAQKGWDDLVKHLAKNPEPGRAAAVAAAARPWCGQCPPPGHHDHRWIVPEDDSLAATKCACHPGAVRVNA